MGKRIEWIDCLKAFLIFLVAFGHLCTCFWCEPTVWDHAHEMAFYDIIYSFHMPAFFFISGICMNNTVGGGGYIKPLSRFLQLVVPALIIGSIFAYSDEGFEAIKSYLVNSPVGSRFWFCFILFEAYLTFFIFNFLIEKTRFTSNNNKTVIYMILALALILLRLILLKYFPNLTTKYMFDYIRFFIVLGYTPWLLVGVIAKLQLETFSKIINSNWLISCAVVLFVCLSFFDPNPYLSNGLADVYGYVKPFLAILILFRIFSMSQNFFSSNNKFGKIMVYVGQRTLPIYLVHYFFIEGMRNISPSFRELVQENWFFEIIIVSAIAIMICGACLAVEKVLQKFPLLHSLAFGFKLKKK